MTSRRTGSFARIRKGPGSCAEGRLVEDEEVCVVVEGAGEEEATVVTDGVEAAEEVCGEGGGR